MVSAHKKVVDLPDAATLSGDEFLYVVQNGLDRRTRAISLGGGATVDEAVVTLTDGVTVAVNASLGNMFHLTALGSRTILAPTGAPVAGRTQKMIIRHFASGSNRTLALTTGVAGGFRFGASITSLSTTLVGTTDYIGCFWNSLDSRWDVVAYSRGL